jgi:hypothetical protein
MENTRAVDFQVLLMLCSLKVTRLPQCIFSLCALSRDDGRSRIRKWPHGPDDKA